jgi:glycerol-1-phosphate dehydrogenase [NAD(P)+]
MPTDHRQLGLTDAQLVDAVLHAPSTRADRYTILEHLDLAPEEVRARVHAFVDAVDR